MVPTIAHLQDEGPAEHPALVDCLLFLKGSEEVHCREVCDILPCLPTSLKFSTCPNSKTGLCCRTITRILKSSAWRC